MGIEELMIGDWVKNPDWYKGKSFSKVENIYGEYPRHIETTCIWRIEAKKIEPIPITPEILEKNGFEAFDDTFYSFENSWLTIRYSFGGHNLEIVSTSIQYDGEIDYVHELQHALRLCKIEKDIVID